MSDAAGVRERKSGTRVTCRKQSRPNLIDMPSALLLTEDLTVTVAGWSPPAPGPGDIVVRTEFAGLCGSDLHVLGTGAWVEYWPAVLGHEVVGVVADGGTSDLAPGTRVVVDSRIPCRDCADCARSPRLCGSLTWLGESRPGGFASELVVPAASAVVVPAGLAADVAVLAEPLAVAMSALDLVPASPVAPATVLVQGYGPVGALLHAEVGRRWPEAQVLVVEPQALRRDLAAGYGAEIDRSPGTAAVDPAPRSAGVDLVIDAAGYPDSVVDALARVRRGGTILLVALGGAPLGLSSQDLVEKGVTVSGSIGFEDRHLPAALAALAADPDRFRGLVSHRVPLSAFAAFLRDGGHRAAAKVVVECDA